MAIADDSMLQLPAVPAAAGMARAFVRRRWGQVLREETLDAVALCVSELVTNALDHASPPYELRITRGDDRLRVEVADATDRPPVLQPVSPSTPRGRGIFLVQCTASKWGVEPSEDGKTVWAEFEVSSAE